MRLEKAFGIFLRRFRDERGFSQEQLALQCGYSRNYISQLECGQKSPSLTTIFYLAQTLQVQPSRFIEMVENAVRTLPKRGGN